MANAVCSQAVSLSAGDFSTAYSRDEHGQTDRQTQRQTMHVHLYQQAVSMLCVRTERLWYKHILHIDCIFVLIVFLLFFVCFFSLSLCDE